MSSSFKSCWIAALALCAMALTALASAQTQNYPTQKGGNARTGNNGNPVLDNPGAANLRWYQPSAGLYANQTEDNESIESANVGTWLAPVLGGLAPNPFTYAGLDTTIGFNYFIPYFYSPVVPSDLSGNPLNPLVGFFGSQFSWSLTQAELGTIANDYALYAYIPAGPTIDAGNNYIYQPEFYVFKINYGTGLTYIDVVDTHLNNGGWVRLGNGGAPSNVLFHYDGATAITISLYNTVPRNSSGQLQGVQVDGFGNLLNTYAVDANAIKAVANYGSIVSSPIIGTDITGTNTSVFVATNQNIVTTQSGTTVTQQKGVLASYAYNWVFPLGPPNNLPGQPGVNWTYSPNDQGSVGLTVAPPSGFVSVTGGFMNGLVTPLTGFAGYVGTTYYYEAVTNNLAAADVANYAPALGLADGTYDVQLWLPGPVNLGVPGYPSFATTVRVEVDQGLVQSFFTVDLTQTNGYVSISPGNRFINTQAAPLVVKITNYDVNAATTDAGKLAFANAVRFVGTENLAITSTPAQAIVPISYTYFDPVQNKNIRIVGKPTSVVVVCGEDGHIYCLDAQGRGDGTTDIYWAYPSLPDPLNANAKDPNNFPVGPDGQNGVTFAQMPTGFSLSSPLIQADPAGNFFLYVAANNGRIYCLDMTGRGDNFLTTRTPGTTTRIWTFPDDYRPDNPTIPSVPSALGATNASLVYNNNPVSGPTIFVPTAQGRMYALDAGGIPVQTTTTIRWAYPAVNAPTVGPFNSTPALDGAAGAQSLFAGTERKNGNSLGQFFSFNVETGAINWVFQGTVGLPTDDFESGPATAFNGLADGVAGSQYVFVANSNGYVYALDNLNNGNVIWQTNELGATVSAPLMFTYETVFNNAPTPAPTAVPQPVVMVPDDVGDFNALFASGPAGVAYLNVNRVGSKFAGGYKSDGDQLVAGTASGHAWMYGADNHGYIYGFNNGNGTLDGSGSIAGPGNAGNIASPNDPQSLAFQGAKTAFINQATYTYLRSALPDTADYNKGVAGIIPQSAFDFGQTLYLLVYDFEYTSAQPGASQPTVTFTFSSQGRTIRAQSVMAQQWLNGSNSGLNDGFAILAFPLNVVGPQSLASGPAAVTTTFQITAQNGGRQYLFGNPNPGFQQLKFLVANPLGLSMALDANSVLGYGAPKDSIGADIASFANPMDPQNAFNGSPSYAPGLGFNPALLYSSVPTLATHGKAADSRTVYVYDRSLMELLNGPDNVINGVAGSFSIRVDRGNAAWNGGYPAVVKPLGGAGGLYGGGVAALETLEDYPTNFPNVSLDYPDILREFITVTSNPQTNSGNPLFSGVTVPNPFGVLDGAGKPLNPTLRTPNPMPLQVDLGVPLYQPANNLTTTLDSRSVAVYSGYTSPMDVYIDSFGAGRLALNGNQRSNYRSWSYGVDVDVSEHMSVLTPNVDLGPLPDGAGIGINPANGTGVQLSTILTPWQDLALTSHIYQPFQAVNDSNVNLLNVRVAKYYNYQGQGYYGWPFKASANDDLGYLDGSLYLWSDLDAYKNGANYIGFSPTLSINGGPLSRGEIFAKKPRTNAVSGRRIVTNPTDDPNGNIGNPGGHPINNSGLFPINQDPRVGITPPIGMPSGSYWQPVRLIEDRNYRDLNPLADTNNYDLSILLGISPGFGEMFADPSFDLSFLVREARLTNSASPHTAPMTGSLIPGGATGSFDSNIEPTGMRDRAFGNLFFAWSSNRTAINNGALANGDYAYRIYGGSLVGALPQNSGSPLNELARFTSANANQWFTTAGPYPFGGSAANSVAANAAFGMVGPDHVVGTLVGEEDTVRFGQPSLPSTGLMNPFIVGDATGATDFGHSIMAFTGSATVQTATARLTGNRLFAAVVQPNSGGSATIGAAIGSTNDLDLPKSKPSVAQVSADTAVIFYGAGSGGRNRLYYTLFNAVASTFSTPVSIDTGIGFDTATDPSAVARLYQGVDAADEAQNGDMIELSFSGRLRGRANNEIFLGRIPVSNKPGNTYGAPDASNSNNELLSYFATRFKEQLELQGGGVYRAVGVDWNPVQNDPQRSIDIGLSTGIAAPVSIITPLTPHLYDAQSGVMTLQTSLGLVYVDTQLGTIRFANTTPGTNYHVFATYQPKFLRVSVAKTAALTGPVLLWDDRHVGSTNFNPGTFQMYDRFWYVGNVHATLTDPRLLNNRYVAVYNRAALPSGGPAISARPLMETLRLGVSVGTTIPTTQAGDVDFTNFAVVGAIGPYQVDPTTGRVYFTALDEDNVVSITVRGVTPPPYKVSLLPEQIEAPIPIDQPINEGRVAAFIDPFDSTGVNTRRPDLLWLLWSSTRTGTADVYFQTIAPILWPILSPSN